jgi:hypothetical protein
MLRAWRRLRRLRKDCRCRHRSGRARSRRNCCSRCGPGGRRGGRGRFRRRDWRTLAGRRDGWNTGHCLRRLWGGFHGHGENHGGSRWGLDGRGRLCLGYNQPRRSSLFQRCATLLTKLGSQVEWTLAEAADGRRRRLWGFRLRHKRRRSFLQPRAALKAEHDILREFRVAIGTESHGRCRAESAFSGSLRLSPTPTQESYYTRIVLSSPARRQV